MSLSDLDVPISYTQMYDDGYKNITNVDVSRVRWTSHAV